MRRKGAQRNFLIYYDSNLYIFRLLLNSIHLITSSHSPNKTKDYNKLTTEAAIVCPLKINLIHVLRLPTLLYQTQYFKTYSEVL
jgi:hypothetical protein